MLLSAVGLAPGISTGDGLAAASFDIRPANHQMAIKGCFRFQPQQAHLKIVALNCIT